MGEGSNLSWEASSVLSWSFYCPGKSFIRANFQKTPTQPMLRRVSQKKYYSAFMLSRPKKREARIPGWYRPCLILWGLLFSEIFSELFRSTSVFISHLTLLLRILLLWYPIQKSKWFHSVRSFLFWISKMEYKLYFFPPLIVLVDFASLEQRFGRFRF